jgi:ribonucleoside-diphosphate reductase alpha chain
MFDSTHQSEQPAMLNSEGSDPSAFKLNYALNDKIPKFAMETFKDSYLLEEETPQDLYNRVAIAGGTNEAHSQRLYGYMSKGWFSPATPILSNLGTSRGLPISCFITEPQDSLESIVDNWMEVTWLSALGGGTAACWSNIREIGAKIGRVGKTSGIIGFMQVEDSIVSTISQGSLRRSNCAVYLDIRHPEIEEFIEIRKTSGGDPRRKVRDLHNAVFIDDAFMEAVRDNKDYDLISPKTGRVVNSISARDMWSRLMELRMETGEPYIIYKDTVNKASPETYKRLGHSVKSSNLCSEIMLHTGKDYLGEQRTAVCCLSSLNIEHFMEWSKEPLFIRDVMEFLDNVLQVFINTAPDKHFAKAIYAAMRERSVGLGVMGFHSFLQAQNLPFGSAVSKSWNKKIFSHIRKYADAASIELAQLRGSCPDAEAAGIIERFTHKIAIAPTASISILSNTTPSIEPIFANAFTHKTKTGSFAIQNKHLVKLLDSLGKNTEEVWLSIKQSKGSVQHLDFLTDDQKDVFRTAIEIDQRWIVEMAGDRAGYIDQAQSINLFFPPDVDRGYLSRVHIQAWMRGVKSLYYCRALALHRSENSTHTVAPAPEPAKYEECLACQ